MGATAEQMSLIDASSMDHVSYILVLLSVACIVFLFANILIYIYDCLTTDITSHHEYYKQHTAERGAPTATDDFELRGLISDEENENLQKRSSESGSSGTLIDHYPLRT